MRLYLVQHGLAKDESEDAARPLSNQGREDVTRTAGFLSLFEKPRPSRILHSGKLRAEQTAQMFAQAWGDLPVEKTLDLAPNDDPSTWIAHLSSMDSDLMLVGHLPHMQRLAGLLISGDPEREAVHFRNGGVLCLEKREAGWAVLWQINPTLFYGED
ncbi:phosphohistidine phosphatase, SixA [Mariprofundus aestuarium]|uniref:Phosphohistidine phosphatase, SixA n=1 Tax=Mariprofundus aestuarium TaxID=1921086 RepID=A0A2K8KXG0_MARES|nr:phosphohistidine phosphatase SixA [Mariprofundus aestuarium]ATX79402.1 phosphohistidine phosphatase, SixA [Mariprofundus aestuarium]